MVMGEGPGVVGATKTASTDRQESRIECGLSLCPEDRGKKPVMRSQDFNRLRKKQCVGN